MRRQRRCSSDDPWVADAGANGYAVRELTVLSHPV